MGCSFASLKTRWFRCAGRLEIALGVLLWHAGGFTAKGNLLGRDVSCALSLGDSAVASQKEVHDEVGKV